jgi:hypothetical protein
MFKHLTQTICVGLILTVLVAPPTAANDIDLINIFNAGVNLGWLMNSLEFGMFPESYATWASDAVAAFNAAFSPPKNLPPPSADKQSAGNYISQIKGLLVNYSGRDGLAYYVFQAGVYLAIADIDSRYGRCPSCLKSSVANAAAHLVTIGRGLRNATLERLGFDFRDRSHNMRPGEMSVADVQTWSATLGNAMATVRASL